MPCTLHRILFSSLLLAAKNLTDAPIKNKSWASLVTSVVKSSFSHSQSVLDASKTYKIDTISPNVTFSSSSPSVHNTSITPSLNINSPVFKTLSSNFNLNESDFSLNGMNNSKPLASANNSIVPLSHKPSCINIPHKARKQSSSLALSDSEVDNSSITSQGSSPILNFFTLAEVNLMERQLLQLLDFELSVTPQDILNVIEPHFDNYLKKCDTVNVDKTHIACLNENYLLNDGSLNPKKDLIACNFSIKEPSYASCGSFCNSHSFQDSTQPSSCSNSLCSAATETTYSCVADFSDRSSVKGCPKLNSMSASSSLDSSSSFSLLLNHSKNFYESIPLLVKTSMHGTSNATFKDSAVSLSSLDKSSYPSHETSSHVESKDDKLNFFYHSAETFLEPSSLENTSKPIHISSLSSALTKSADLNTNLLISDCQKSNDIDCKTHGFKSQSDLVYLKKKNRYIADLTPTIENHHATFSIDNCKYFGSQSIPSVDFSLRNDEIVNTTQCISHVRSSFQQTGLSTNFNYLNTPPEYISVPQVSTVSKRSLLPSLSLPLQFLHPFTNSLSFRGSSANSTSESKVATLSNCDQSEYGLQRERYGLFI